MDLNKLRKRIAEEEVKLKRFEEQRKFSQINSEADFKKALKEWALKQKETKQPTPILTKPTHQRGFFLFVVPGVKLVESEQQFVTHAGHGW